MTDVTEKEEHQQIDDMIEFLEISESLYNDTMIRHLIMLNFDGNRTLSLIDSQRDNVLPTEAKVLLIIAYSILCIISTFGNALVCYVILKNKRLHTPTNYFLANLAVSDLLVTFINVPFNLAKNFLYDWPFGQIPCHIVHYSLVLTCYVSTYTLTSIALDRHRVVLKPLSRRMSTRLAIGILACIWAMAICLSLPYGIFTRVRKVTYLITTEYRRCRFLIPKDWKDLERFLTMSTFILQYCIPFTLIGIAYARIVLSLWARTHVGAVTANQQLVQARAKRRSIRLLITVVIMFAICWLPLNMYHILTDLHPDMATFHYDSLAFFICHWIAMSSTCYNPFVYCWLNEQFRQEVKSRFYWCYKVFHKKRHSGIIDVIAMGKTNPKNLSSCCYNSIKRDTTTTTATYLLKDSTEQSSDNRHSVVTKSNLGSLSVAGISAEEETHSDVTEEATQGLVVQSDVSDVCASEEEMFHPVSNISNIKMDNVELQNGRWPSGINI